MSIVSRMPECRIESGVVFGANGQLFLADGGHRILDFVTGRSRASDQSVTNFWQNIESREAHARAGGAGYLHVIFPDKQSVLSGDFPFAVASCLGDQYLASRPSDVPVLYLKSFLAEMSAAPFLTTDTHLTDAASIGVAGEIAERLTQAPSRDVVRGLLVGLTVETDHAGDLGSRFTPKLSAKERFFAGDGWIRLFSNRLTRNDGIIDIRINFKAPSAKRVLFFGDSFGRSVARFLAGFFREVLFLRSRFFHPEIFDLYQPDLLVTENVERYLDDCAPDDERDFFFMYPYLGEAPVAYAPAREFAEALSAVLSYPRSPYQRFVDRIRPV